MMDSTEQTWWVNLSLHRWEVHLNQYIPNGGFLPAALKSLISPVFNSHFTWNKELKHHTHLICQCHLKPHTWSVLLTMVEGEEWRMEKPIILLFKFCKMCTLPFCDSSNTGSSWAEETVQLYRLCRQWRRRLCKQSSGATMTKCPMPRGWFTNLEGGLTLVLHLHALPQPVILFVGTSSLTQRSSHCHQNCLFNIFQWRRQMKAMWKSARGWFQQKSWFLDS